MFRMNIYVRVGTSRSDLVDHYGKKGELLTLDRVRLLFVPKKRALHECLMALISGAIYHVNDDLIIYNLV